MSKMKIKKKKNRVKYEGRKIYKYALENRDKKLKYEMKLYYLLLAFFDYKVERQVIIDGKYIVDLFIPLLYLVIEVDGEYHQTLEQTEKDKSREYYLKTKGYKVLRFSNEQIKTDLKMVLTRLEIFIKKILE